MKQDKHFLGTKYYIIIVPVKIAVQGEKIFAPTCNRYFWM